MKKTIAIVAGGDSSEHDVSLRSAEGIHSFLDKERYEVYIIEIKGMTWEAHLKDGSRSNVDRNDFSFMEGGKRIHHHTWHSGRERYPARIFRPHPSALLHIGRARGGHDVQ